MATSRYSRVFWVIPLFTTISLFSLPAYAKYSGGSGEPNDPYLIYTAEQMNAIGAEPNDWDKRFKLMSDIDLSDYTGTEFNIIGYGEGWWASDENKSPFTGVFDGNGRTISNFNYSSKEGDSYVGIFGYIRGATLLNLTVIDPNVRVERMEYSSNRGEYVGSLVGLSLGTIKACCIKGGSVAGHSAVGGLVGYNGGTITQCASSTAVLGHSNVGGIAGHNQNGTIGDSYSLGDISGTTSVGGLVGYSGYSTIAHCYSTGKVQGSESVGGLSASNDRGEILNCYWDIESSGQTVSAGGTGKTTEEMQTASTYAGWGDYAIWTINEGLDYPRLQWENLPGEMLATPSFPSVQGSGTQDDPYLIDTAGQLSEIGLFPLEWDKHFRLAANIDLTDYPWTTSNMIGRYVGYPSSGVKPFSGVFDGGGYTISNFKLSGDATNIGIFGRTEGAEIRYLHLADPNVEGFGSYVGLLVGWLRDGTVSNCSAESGRIFGSSSVGGFVGMSNRSTISDCSFSGIVSGGGEVGGIVGNQSGTITNCHFSGEILATGNRAGGLAGHNSLEIVDCSVSARVSGEKQVGGLVGAQRGGRISNCHVTGSLTGLDEVGGFIGGNNGFIVACYTTSDVTGQTSVGGFVGQNGLNLTDVVSRGYIYNCYARGSVTGEKNIGGFAGYNDYFGIITNSYATGRISGTSEVGGFVGHNPHGDISDSFWDIEASGQVNSAGGTGMTTAEMQDSSSYMKAGWDFAEKSDGPHDIWSQAADGGYPILWWELSPLPLLPVFSGGSGEPNDPYLIASADDLNLIGHNPRLMEATFRLIDDVDLSDAEMFLIGNLLFPFHGSLDGNNKKIIGLKCHYPGTDNIGLFRCTSGADIKNLHLVDPNIDCSEGARVGALIGWGSGTISGCRIAGGRVRGSRSVGILAGRMSGSVSGCFVTGSVHGYQGVGGLIGGNYGTISDCGATAHVAASYSAGGLVGGNVYNGIIERSYAESEVTIQFNHAGGLIGTNERNATVRTCYARGSVTGRSGVGGLVGRNNEPSMWQEAALISNCYSFTETMGASKVGGLVGSNGGSVLMSYSAGGVVGESELGGLIGYNDDEGVVVASLWDKQTSSQIVSSGGSGHTTAEMQSASGYLDVGWDFLDETANGTEDIWRILEGQDYPRLWWEQIPEN